MGPAEEWRSLSRLGGLTFTGAVDVVRDVHEAVLTRAESLLPSTATPVTRIHRRLSGAVYSGVTHAPRLPLAVGAEVAAWRWGPHRPPPTKTGLGERSCPLSMDCGATPSRPRARLRRADDGARGRTRPGPAPYGVAAAFPGAGGRLVVFVDGLCESDESWRRTPSSDAAASVGSTVTDWPGTSGRPHCI